MTYQTEYSICAYLFAMFVWVHGHEKQTSVVRTTVQSRGSTYRSGRDNFSSGGLVGGTSGTWRSWLTSPYKLHTKAQGHLITSGGLVNQKGPHIGVVAYKHLVEGDY